MAEKGWTMSVLDELTEDDWIKLNLRVIKLEEQNKQFAEFGEHVAISLRMIASWIARHG